MTDYIKREDAKRVLNKGLCYMRAFGVNRCLTMIDEVPSSDAVEVVRCENCKYWYRYIRYCDHNICDFWSTDSSLLTKHDDFCSHGERAEA